MRDAAIDIIARRSNNCHYSNADDRIAYGKFNFLILLNIYINIINNLLYKIFK